MYKGKQVTAVVLAAGMGLRFGGSVNKAFVCVRGKPLLLYSLQVMEAHPWVDRILLTCREADEPVLRRLLELYPCRLPVQVVRGGETRRDSVYNALERVKTGIVLVHDGVRPLVTGDLVSRCVEAMDRFPACTAAVHASDTVKLAGADGVVLQTTRRADTWLAQTPQCFDAALLRRAHRLAPRDPDITDDCMLMELAGCPVKLVEGSCKNVKVTVPADLAVVESLL